MRVAHTMAHGCAVVFLSLVTGVARAQNPGAPTPSTRPAPPSRTAAPAPAPALDRTISLDVHGVTLREALRAIGTQADVRLVYSDRVVPLERRVSVRVHDGTVREALRQALTGTEVEAQEADGSVVLARRQRSEVAPDTTWGGVWGQVRDSTTGRPLAGVQMSVRGTTSRWVTNDSGYYLMRAPFGPQIVVARLVGYDPVERVFIVADSTVSAATRLDIIMRLHAAKLQEVVVTATGVQRRLELANDITIINVDSVMQTTPIRTVTDLLETRVPGLEVLHTSGEPGAPSRIRLRGISSISRNSDPILVIDGVRVDISESGDTTLAQTSQGTLRSHFLSPSRLDQIDPNSIETLEVFKGPSAAALYGPDAANGVIVITTKRARPGPAHWQLSVTQGMSELPGSYPVGLFRFGHIVGGGTSILCPPTQYTCVADSLVAFQALNDARFAPLGRGRRTAVSASVSGGSAALQYSFTGSGSYELGILRLPDVEAQRYQTFRGSAPPSWMRRPDHLTTWSGTSQLSSQLSPNARVELLSTLTTRNQQQSSLESAISVLRSTYVDRSQLGRDPLIPEFYERATSKALDITNIASLNWQPWSWLPITASLGLNVGNRDDESLLPPHLHPFTLDSAGHFGAGTGRLLTRSANIGTNLRTPLPLGMHMLTSVGMNLTATSFDSRSVGGYGVADGEEEPRFLTGPTSQSSSNATTIGWYVAPSFAITPRLFLSTGYRLDGGSTSGTHATFNGFPKLGASWLVSDEKFFPLRAVFSTLRVRLAYGHAGVQPGLTDRLRLYESGSIPGVSGSLVDILHLLSLGNTRLRPERSTELEGGFDADLFDGRVSVSYTGYDKLRRDALVTIPVAPSVHGGGTYTVNLGEVSNKGAEVTLGLEPLRSAPLTWRVNLNLSTNANKLVRLAPGQPPIDLGQERLVPGYPLFGRWAKPVVGWLDANRDHLIDTSEVILGDTAVYIGQPLPKYHASMSTSLGLLRGRVTVDATFDYQDGQTQLDADGHDPLLLAANDPRASEAEQAAVAALDKTPFGLIQTVNTLRFNSLSVSVAMPDGVARAFRARTMSVALQGTNLGLHTNYRSLDPTVNAGEHAQDEGQLPQPRTWELSVRFGT